MSARGVTSAAPGPAWESSIPPAAYLADFPLPIPVLEARWTSEVLPDGARSVTLPNRVSVRLSGAASDLGFEEPEEFQTTMLWKHSLAALQLMLTSGDVQGARSILDGYADFIESERWAELSERMTSLDHCVASRIRTICALRAIFATLEAPLPDSAIAILETDLAWASEPSRYASNNHGIMLGIATMHAAEVFPRITPEAVAAVGTARFDEILAAAFDETGVCVENTPEYQGFYLTLCTNTKKFLEMSSTDNSRVVAHLSELRERAAAALSRMLLPNGAYPALGDSGSLVEGPVPSVDGTTYSPATGIYISKAEGVFFSFKCGYTSYVHKHMDDTSVTLQVDGEDLILDAGLHNYDWHDPITRAVKSQRGHSGFFFPEFDHLYPSTMYRPEEYRVRSRLRRLSDGRGSVLLSGRSVIDDTHCVARLLEHGSGTLEIVDRYWVAAAVDEFADPVQRFLVPTALVEERPRPGLLRFVGAGAWLEIEFDPDRAVTITTGGEGELPLGWVSRAWSRAVPCRSVEIGVSARGAASRATLRYGRRTEQDDAVFDRLRVEEVSGSALERPGNDSANRTNGAM